MDPNLVILAGGISSRMKEDLSTTIDPESRREAAEKAKTMIGVGAGRRPLLDYLLYNAREAGYHDVVIVVGEKDRSIREYYGQVDERNTELHLSYAVQSIPAGRVKPIGTADALLQGLRSAPRWREQKFTVCNSDNLYSRKALQLMLECPGMGGMIDYDRSALGFEQARIEQFAVTEKTDDGFLVNIIEKPSSPVIERVRDRSGRVGVSMNIFRLPYDQSVPIIESVPINPVRQEKELPTAIAMFIQVYPKSLRAIPVAEYVPDLTSQADIVRVQEYLKREFPEFTFQAR
jgi:NDP-sugar pyrophosphorylase family protein